MTKERLTAFSDGVIAIIITIMVLELKIPHSAEWSALSALLPVFLSYALSFIYIAIYWNNHHHLMYTCEKIDASILWANMHLLFWLSLIPFVTGWAGENHFESAPTALYGIALLMPAIAYYLLQIAIVRRNGEDGVLAKALGNNLKAKISPLLYISGFAFAFFVPWVSMAIYAVTALIWVIPDRRIERAVTGPETQKRRVKVSR